MSFISLFKKYPAIVFALLLILLLEGAARVFPLHYAEGAGVFMTHERRELAESSKPEFDYIVLGDSRSLSLMGHAPTDGEPWSLYNFSLPAMGPRYYRFFLEKILENRAHKPAAVLFAADPQVFFEKAYAPLHDRHRIYTPDHKTTLAEYLKNRVVRRLQILFGLREGEPANEGVVTDELIWENFSHRFLRMFSPMELARQYVGPERIFVLSEALPFQYATYRHRKGIEGVVLGSAITFREAKPLADVCTTCEGLMQPACHQKLSKIEDNKNIERGLEERYGQINLADRLTPIELLAYRSIQEEQIKVSVDALNQEKPDLSAMKAVLDFAKEQGVRVVIMDVPHIEEYKNTRYFQTFFPMVQKLASQYENATVIRFPDPYYPAELFAEQVHYSCEGAEKLNREFYRFVMPEILEFAPPENDNRIRGFQNENE